MDSYLGYATLAVGIFTTWRLAPRGGSFAIALAWATSFAGHTIGHLTAKGRIVTVLFFGAVLVLVGLIGQLRNRRGLLSRGIVSAIGASGAWLGMGALGVDSLFGGENWLQTNLEYSALLTASAIFLDAILLARLLTSLGLKSLACDGMMKALSVARWVGAVGCIDFMRRGIAWSDTDIWVMSTLSVTAGALLVYCHVHFCALVVPSWLRVESAD